MSPGDLFIGGGVWHPEASQLAAFRDVVDRDPRRIHAVIDEPAFVRTFGSVTGGRLSRVPRGFSPDHPEAELLKLKDVGFGRRLADDDVTSPALVDLLADTLATAVPMMRLLATLAA